MEGKGWEILGMKPFSKFENTESARYILRRHHFLCYIQHFLLMIRTFLAYFGLYATSITKAIPKHAKLGFQIQRLSLL